MYLKSSWPEFTRLTQKCERSIKYIKALSRRRDAITQCVNAINEKKIEPYINTSFILLRYACSVNK